MARTRLNPVTQLGAQNKDFGKKVSLLYLSCCYSSTAITFSGSSERFITVCSIQQYKNKGDAQYQL